MTVLVRLLLSLELAATGCEQLIPGARRILPLGGSDLAQLGLILILAVAYAELRALRARRRQRARRRARRRASGGAGHGPAESARPAGG